MENSKLQDLINELQPRNEEIVPKPEVIKYAALARTLDDLEILRREAARGRNINSGIDNLKERIRAIMNDDTEKILDLEEKDKAHARQILVQGLLLAQHPEILNKED